jgi:hypothetical protein
MKLNNVTIAAVAGTKAIETLKAIKYSMKELEFDRAILITPDNLYDDQVEIIKCDTLNYEQYNHFIVYRLHEYINTTHCLLVQNDGYVINPDRWQDSWMQYDYIGALWHLPQDNFSFRDSEGNIQRVGNGGFTLRSKNLLCVANDLNLEWKSYYGFYHEDGFICCHNRKAYELAGCKFAPIEVAAEFSHETIVAENYGKIPFGFHGKNNYYYQATQNNL